MTMRLTDDEVSEFCLLVDSARDEGDHDGECGMQLDEFLDNHVKQIADELLERRRADLTDEEREALRWVQQALVMPFIYQPHKVEWPFPERLKSADAALAVLTKLIGGGKAAP